jgi:glutamate 5-kinase
MPDSFRQEVLSTVKTVVVKVGTRVLTRPDATLNLERIARLAEELSFIMSTGRRVVLVSSGAVGAGVGLLKLGKRPSDVAKLQAVAAIGQMHLIQYYDHIFNQHGRRAAQVLLTGEDLNDRQRYLNVRNTLLSILEFGAVPIINENDTVSVDELMITFGDNDRLAAMVASLLRAELLVILSDVAGLYDGDPALPESKLVPTVKKIDGTILGFVRDKLTGLSKGGMASKLNAAKMVTSAGEHCLIASGRQEDVLTQIIQGETIGTLFLPQGKTISPFKRWLGFSAQPKGRISIDDGATRAIVEQGKSLLAIGVVHVEGKFKKGDVIDLYDSSGQLVARGLTNYDLDDLAKIQGLRSEKVAQVLGTEAYEEVIHRDNLAVVKV